MNKKKKKKANNNVHERSWQSTCMHVYNVVLTL